METEASTVQVDMGLRTQERQQLDRWVPRIIEHLEGLGLPQSAEDLDDVTLVIEESDRDGFRYEAAAEPDEWRTLISSLSNQDGQDAWWLRKKLARRFHDRVDEMEEMVDDAD